MKSQRTSVHVSVKPPLLTTFVFSCYYNQNRLAAGEGDPYSLTQKQMFFFFLFKDERTKMHSQTCWLVRQSSEEAFLQIILSDVSVIVMYLFSAAGVKHIRKLVSRVAANFIATCIFLLFLFFSGQGCRLPGSENC